MKRLFRKNQIIITSLAIMIVIAGYLNFTADQTKPVKQEAAAETAEKIREENIQAEEAAVGAEADITSFPDEDLASVSAEAESTADTETPEGENVGEAVLTSSASAGAFSASAKLNREQVRSKNEASLLEIINNTDISEDMKADAIASMNRMTDRAEKELDAELLLEAKGFKDSVVSINDDSVDVIVGAAEITDEQKAQIEDIVTRKTERNVSDIVITTME
uniref:SpoIIIAH-like family protein n=1 Tax=Coprococcus catus TaxID=116085 RepID=UPI0022E39912|nr:SpoIIIAH-like family protein [Coprococcus catus]